MKGAIMTSRERAEAQQLDKALTDIIKHRCANCGKQARPQMTLCNACWCIAADQELRAYMMACTPETLAN
jgi:uncharacterized OB-fold protein